MVAQSEVHGATIETTVNQIVAVFRRRIERALSEQGIDEIEDDEWYPLVDFIDVLEMVEEDAGEATLRQLGAVAPESLKWTTGPNSVAEGLAALDDGCRTRHRKLPGSYEFESTGANSGRLVVDTPYPCVFDQGLIKGTAEKFGAEFARIREVGTQCRSDGGRTCTYEVSW